MYTRQQDFWTPKQLAKIALAGNSLAGLRVGLEHGFKNEQEFYFAAAQDVAILSVDQWKQIDTALRLANEFQLGFVNDMRSMGLTRQLDGPGVMLSQYERVTNPEDAVQNMSGRARSELQDVNYELEGVPVPITHFDFQLEWRRLVASARNGRTPLDTTLVTIGTRKVENTLEEVSINGNPNIVLNGQAITGIAEATANVGALTAQWTDAAADPVQDIIDMKQALVAQGFPSEGPFNVYIPSKYSGVLDEEYKAESDRTLKQKLESIEGINKVTVSSKVRSTTSTITAADDTIIMVHMDFETVQLDIAADTTTVAWDIEGGFATNFKVLAIMVLLMKQDADDNQGIAVFSA